MTLKESSLNQIKECGPSDAIILRKGEMGKTKKPLVGCMVPVLQCRERIIVGHFGPREPKKAGSRIGNLLQSVIPDQVSITMIRHQIPFGLITLASILY